MHKINTTTTTYFELDDISSDDHTHTLYEITDDVDEGCLHVDVLNMHLLFQGDKSTTT